MINDHDGDKKNQSNNVNNSCRRESIRIRVGWWKQVWWGCRKNISINLIVSERKLNIILNCRADENNSYETIGKFTIQLYYMRNGKRCLLEEELL